MISIVSNNMIRFNIKSIANYLLFPKNEVHYIGGAEILPAPLSSEEETLLLTHLDDDVLEARQTLIEHNLRLVVYIAKKFDNTGVGVECYFRCCLHYILYKSGVDKFKKNQQKSTFEHFGAIACH